MAGLYYRIKNWRATWRAFWLGSYVTVDGAVARLLGNSDRITMRGTLSAVLHRADGTSLNLGVICKRVVTTAGVNYMRNDFLTASSNRINAFNQHDCGTGTGGELVGNTALGTPYGGARALGVQTNLVDKQYQTVGTIVFTSTLAITEHGLFSASSGGTLWDRSVFAAINVVLTDSIVFTYILTINDGG